MADPAGDGWCVDEAPGERRVARVESGQIVALHLIRDGAWYPGDIGTGRIKEKGAGGPLLVTDQGEEILIRGACPAEGQTCRFVITRAALPEPGLIKRAEARAATPADGADGRIDPVLRLSGGTPKPASAPMAADMDDVLVLAQSGQSLAGSAILTFQRTKAGLVIDVDGTGDAAAINLDAARDVARLLRLYQLGGMVMVDFIASASKAARLAIGEAFDAAAAADPRPFERTAVNGFGLMQVVRPRPVPALLDQLFGTRIASLSDETQALILIRQAARSSGYGERIITARPAVAAVLNGPLAACVADAARRCGAAIRIVADPAVPGYGHVHVAQS